MEDTATQSIRPIPPRVPWNKGKLVGQKDRNQPIAGLRQGWPSYHTWPKLAAPIAASWPWHLLHCGVTNARLPR